MTETPQPERPSPEQMAVWRRRLASQANNRAWDLAESVSRTENDDDEMLSAAHAAAFFWSIVGNAGNRAHAELLLAHVYGLLRLGQQASRHLSKARQFFAEEKIEPSELAIFHIVQANVAAACGDAEGHRTGYAMATKAIDALPDAQNRQLMSAALSAVPAP
jgi:hypothetical protein